MKTKSFRLFAAALLAALAALNSCKKDDPVPVIKITAQIVAPGELTEGSIPADTKLEVKASVTEGATLTYQWYTNTSAGNTGGTAISGATLSTYTIPTDIKAGTYYYFCEVSAPGAKAVRSNGVTVKVNVNSSSLLPVISIVRQPEEPDDLYEGQIPDSVRLTVEALVTRDATLKYQWHRFDPEKDELFQAIDSATSAAYKIPTDLEAGEYWFVCGISADGATAVQTDPVKVTVLLFLGSPNEGLTLSSSSISLTVGGSTTLTVTNSDCETFTWESSNPAVATVDQSGRVTAVAAGTATITVTDCDGRKGTATVNVSPAGPTNPPLFTPVGEITLTSDDEVEVNQELQLEAEVNPDATNQDIVWTIEPGGDPEGTGATVTPDGEFTATIKDGNGPGEDYTVTFPITVTAPPAVITSQPKDATATTGSSTSFSVTATGAASYQWQYAVSGSSFWNTPLENSVFGSVDTPTLTLSYVTTSLNGYKFRCKAINAAGEVTYSAPAGLIFEEDELPLDITRHPSDATVAKGGTATFSIEATGAKTYQWQVGWYGYWTYVTWEDLENDDRYSGVNGSTLTVKNVLVGNRYRCEVSDGKGNTMISAEAKLTVTH
jgi:hypothetical protein